MFSIWRKHKKKPEQRYRIETLKKIKIMKTAIWQFVSVYLIDFPTSFLLSNQLINPDSFIAKLLIDIRF